MLILTAIAAALAFHTTLAVDISGMLSQGDAAFANGEFNSAIRHYSSAIELDPTTVMFYTKRAAAYMSLRQHSQALRDLDRAVDMDGNFKQGYIHRGRLHRQVCNVNKARSDFEAVLKIKPEHKTAMKELQLLGDLQRHMDMLQQLLSADTEAAKGAVKQVLDAAPDCVAAQLAEATLEMQQGNYEQVVAITGRLVKSQPSHLEGLTLRGTAYMYQGDHDLAKRHYGEALKYDPDYSPARKAFNKVKDLDRKRQRADKAYAAGEWAEAESAYQAALAVDPLHSVLNTQLMFGLCQVQKAASKYTEALASCQQVLAMEGGHAAASRELVRILMEAEQFQEAVNKAKELWKQNQGDGEVHELLREAEKRLKMSKRKDYYKILDVAKDAAERDIKSAYKRLAKMHHPDKVPPSEREAAANKFREIAEAYEVLTNEEKRGAYDRGEDLEEQGHGGGWGHQQWGNFGGQQFTFHFNM